jgi:hypothetical protein
MAMAMAMAKKQKTTKAQERLLLFWVGCVCPGHVRVHVTAKLPRNVKKM